MVERESRATPAAAASRSPTATRCHESRSCALRPVAAANSLNPGSSTRSLSLSSIAASSPPRGSCAGRPDGLDGLDGSFSGGSLIGGEHARLTGTLSALAGAGMLGKSGGGGISACVGCASPVVWRAARGWIGVIPNATRTECARWWWCGWLCVCDGERAGGDGARELHALPVELGPCDASEYGWLRGLLPLLLGPLESCGVGTPGVVRSCVYGAWKPPMDCPKWSEGCPPYAP